jgi:hypothetical protein
MFAAAVLASSLKAAVASESMVISYPLSAQSAIGIPREASQVLQFIRISSSGLKARICYHAGKYQMPHPSLSKLVIEICVLERA